MITISNAETAQKTSRKLKWEPVISYIALGSNLNEPTQQVKTALLALNNIAGCQVLKHSSLHKSPPLGPQDQPDFINAVAKIQTTLSAHHLLSELQSLENTHNRVRQQHWGPRTLDLDILLYGDSVINTNDLVIPHPEMTKRDFVLTPLWEIEPTLVFPDGQSLADTITITLCNNLVIPPYNPPTSN